MERRKSIGSNSNVSLFKQYLLLFFIVAFIPVIISCTSFYFSYKALKNEVIHANQASTRLIHQSLDSKTKELDKTIQVMKQDSTLTRYALKNSPLTACNSLEKYTSMQSILTDVMIVPLNADDTIYSSKGVSNQEDLKHQIFMKEFISSGYSCDNFYETIYNTSAPTYWPANTLDNTPRYLCRIEPFYTYQTNQYTAQALILLINQDYIHDIFRSSQTVSEENILLLNENRELLSHLTPQASTQVVLELCEYLQRNTGIDSNIELTLDGESYLVFTSYSTDSHLYYIRFLSKDIAYGSINTVRNYIIFIMLFVFCVSILLIYYGMKKSYQPIRSLADWIQQNHESDIQTNNELILFKQTFENTLEQKSILTSTLSGSRQGLVDHLLTTLICGNFLTEESFFNACQNLDIQLNQEYYCVCSLIIEEQIVKNSDTNFATISDIIHNAASPELSLQIKDLTLAEKLIIILNSSSADMDYYKSELKKIQSILQEELMLITSIGMGSIYNSYNMVGKSYLESTNALDYRLIYGKSCIITPDVYLRLSSEEKYPNEDLDYLNFAFTSQKTDIIIGALQKLKTFTKSKECNLHMAKYICYDIFSMLMKLPYFTDLGYTSKYSQRLSIIQLSNFETIDDFFTTLIDLVNNLFETELTTTKENPDTKTEMLDYIHTHCFNYDFQISKMAEDFNITPQYLRKVFKNKTGITLSEYISQIKLEKAMELLRDTDLNLNDIVIEIGNTEISGFMRFFKKRTGMTPGQYRSLNKNQE